MAEPEQQSETERPRTVPSYVAQTVGRLQNGYLGQSPRARATLAQLRRLNGATDEGVLEALGVAFTDLPEEIVGWGDQASKKEKATAAALILYAIHQQSQTKPVHVPGIGLGTAVRRLANPSEGDSREKPVMRRFQALTTASDFNEVLHHLRGLIQQFRANDVQLDYARLSRDLLNLQYPDSVTGVRLGWARELSRTEKKEDSDTAEQAAAVEGDDASTSSNK